MKPQILSYFRTMKDHRINRKKMPLFNDILIMASFLEISHISEVRT